MTLLSQLPPIDEKIERILSQSPDSAETTQKVRKKESNVLHLLKGVQTSYAQGIVRKEKKRCFKQNRKVLKKALKDNPNQTELMKDPSLPYVAISNELFLFSQDFETKILPIALSHDPEAVPQPNTDEIRIENNPALNPNWAEPPNEFVYPIVMKK